MSDTNDSASISRRQLFGQGAVVAAAGVGLAALQSQEAAAAAAAAAVTSVADRPKLPLRILSKAKLGEEYSKQMRAISPEITFIEAGDWATELPKADVVIGKILPEEMPLAKKLRWAQSTSVGVEVYLTPEFVKNDVLLTNTKGCSAPPISDHAMGFLLALTRGIGLQATRRRWDGFDAKQVELAGMTMGIVGLGGIGRAVAKRARAFDMRVIAVDSEPMTRERYTMVDELWLVDTHFDELLKQSDVVVCCAPHTHRTRGMFGEKQFAMMKDGVYFINVTRGPIVKTDALVAALKSKKIAGAGLDVTDPEPLPADHPLWKMENVIITPHKAVTSPQCDAREDALFVENVRRYVTGLPMLAVVDKQKGY